ncbi:MAG: SusC/RagA family TonB-linked outer membrane protein [Draconibacterium sp.]
MKLIGVFMFVVLLQVSASSYSQTKQLTIKGNHLTLEELFEMIESQSEFSFMYNLKQIDLSKEVDADFRNQTVNQILNRVLEGSNITYTVNDRLIVIHKNSEMDLINKLAENQQGYISGKVSDSSGQSLPGVTVVVKGTTRGTVTDTDGNFSLSNIEDGIILQFSFVGMRTMEVEVSGQSQIDVTMEVDAIGLDEVVAIGYGVQKKSDIINSVVSVDAGQLIKAPTSDIGDMLRGKAAGVFVTSSDAGPGSSSNILIRGKNSINGGNSPLVIADGVPVFNINDINPNDIASMEILKDAAAQAIYGARASNGVILITTKRAKAGETKVNYRGYYGAQTIGQNFDLYNGDEFAQLRREATRTDNNGEYLPDDEIFTPIELEVLNNKQYVDWMDVVLRTGSIQNHNIGIASGTEKNRVYSSFDYLNQKGVIPGTDFKKFTVRLNVDQKITDWLTLGANTSWYISKNNDPGTGNTLKWLVTASPLSKIYNDDGSLRFTPSGVQESINPSML